MSIDNALLEELTELVVVYTSGAANDAQFMRLEQLLKASEKARVFYVDLLDMHANLYGYCRQPREKMKDGLGDMMFRAEDAGSGRLSFPDCSIPSAAIGGRLAVSPSPPLTSLGTTIHGTIGFFSSDWPLAYLVATVIFGIGLLIGSLVPVSQPVQVARQSVPLPSPLSPLHSVVGRITGMVDCQWVENPKSEIRNPKEIINQKSKIINPKSLVSLGDKYTLASGLMEITYDTGAKVILQGPVTYEVESASGGYLAVGKLTARVEKKVASGQWRVASKSEIRNQKSEISNPQSLIPNPSPLSTIHYPLFTIKTPTATVTDLGTEFGVEVRQDGMTETEVFVGAVKMESVRGAAGIGQGLRLVTAGQSARAAKGTIVLVAADPGIAGKTRFLRAMPTSNQSYMADAYAELVLSMQPAVYYRMERPKNETDRNVVFDSAPGGHHGVLHLANEYGGDPWWPGRFGSAIYLRGPEVGDYAVVPDYPKATGDQLTVSAWVYAVTRSPMWSLIAANWGMDVHGQFHFGLEREGDLTIEVSPRDKQRVLVREGPSHPLPVYQWQHVAFVVDESVVRLYRNAVEVAEGPCNGVLPNPPLPNLMIGSKNNDAGSQLTMPPLHWHGRIDELAVFNRALRPEQIRELYQGRTPAGQEAADVKSDSAEISNSAGATVQPPPQQQNAK